MCLKYFLELTTGERVSLAYSSAVFSTKLLLLLLEGVGGACCCCCWSGCKAEARV